MGGLQCCPDPLAGFGLEMGQGEDREEKGWGKGKSG